MSATRRAFFVLNLCFFAYNTLVFIIGQHWRDPRNEVKGHTRTKDDFPLEKRHGFVCPDCEIQKPNPPLIRDGKREDSMGFTPYHPASKSIYSKQSKSAERNRHVTRLDNVAGVNCRAIIAGDKHEENKTNIWMRTRHKVPIMESQYLDWTQNCSYFKSMRRYILTSVTQEEEDFPLAFSIAMYKDLEQTERLLRAIYQPQNIYCIHVDLKSPLLLHRAVQSIVSCFDNVFIASRLDVINWGDSSVLSPVLNCMRDLVTYFRGRWKYFINLTGQEFPLRSNYELVRIAKIFNGSNDITGSLRRAEPHRTRFRWKYRWSKTYRQVLFYNSFVPKSPPPYNIRIYKGEVHGLFSQRFVEYIVSDERAKKLLEWCEDSGHASEHYWNTLNYNVHLRAPGGYTGSISEAEHYSFHDISRAKHWNEFLSRRCAGRYVRGICVFGVGDLPWLAARWQLFANKLYLIDHYVTLDCLEELHRNRTLLGRHVHFDEDVYKQLPTVKFSRKDGLSR